MGRLDSALEKVDMTYAELSEIANGMLSKCLKDCNAAMAELNANINNLTNDSIRIYLARLSSCSYSLSEIKEKSLLKTACSETVRKETYAEEFNKAEGSVAARENTATINASESILVEAVYDMVSSSLKTKIDEIHRVVDTLKTILMSRVSEAKLLATVDDSEN